MEIQTDTCSRCDRPGGDDWPSYDDGGRRVLVCPACLTYAEKDIWLDRATPPASTGRFTRGAAIPV